MRPSDILRDINPLGRHRGFSLKEVTIVPQLEPADPTSPIRGIKKSPTTDLDKTRAAGMFKYKPVRKTHFVGIQGRNHAS